ncbi:dienelactone hydrolase family protein [Hwanghaeella grinnelliae]|uniref:Dienelactone hydrolase family protein n=2 Tax=Hwanghaeella grinnelliae TaxID=2500179 RepID=A0A3S2VTV4_9PROT|nr:dienelactone hydrolase family protein [Hwanghaeella grinnelliae]
MESVAVLPENDGSLRPCVLVCHDWSGINEYTLETCEKLVALGYAALAVDAYGAGLRGDPVGDNSHLMTPCLQDRDLLQERLLAGLAAAADLAGVNAENIAALGYCFGGLCALDLARRNPDGLRGVVTVHGALNPPPSQSPTASAPAPMRARVLMLHGWADPIVPPAEVKGAFEEFTAAGANWEMQIYGHAMHAFTFTGAAFPERGIQHHPHAHRRSWKTTCTFLEETLMDDGIIRTKS